jgi:conjugal transfer ATP-binding protein TraC
VANLNNARNPQPVNTNRQAVIPQRRAFNSVAPAKPQSQTAIPNRTAAGPTNGQFTSKIQPVLKNQPPRPTPQRPLNPQFASRQQPIQNRQQPFSQNNQFTRQVPPSQRQFVNNSRGQFGPSISTQQQTPQKKKSGFFSRKPSKPNPKSQPAIDRNSAQFLKTLDAVGLRKEVIQTEVEIQKALIESEKAYREGVSTIRDLIAPSSVKISTGQVELGTKIARSFFVLVYPRVISSGWLEGLVNADIPMDISIFVYPRDSSEVLKELKKKVGKIQASLQLNNEKGAARDPQLETAYQDVEGLRDAIQQGTEKFFRVGVYFTIYSDTNEQLEKYSQAMEGLLSQQNITTKRAALQMDEGFNATLPILKDDLDVTTNMNTGPLSACFPFVSSELSSDSGILYGINRHNSSLIIFDRFELENANEVVFATSGAGKSYTVKLEILRSLMLGVSVIVIDPEQEYKILADTLGGAYISMSLNSENRINPFDLPKALPGESNADILRTSVIDLMGLMNLMLGKLSPEEVSIMERAIQESYAKRDITPESDFDNVTPPTMADLVDILNGIVGGESLAQRLYRYTEGTFSGLFNNRTNININNSFVVFNIRDLQEALRPIAMYILLKYVWNEIRSELKRRILTIDEAWIMMQYEDSARFLYGLVKRARKYYLGVTAITQDVGDFLGSPFGKPIVTNSALKILLKQSSASIELIAKTFALTTGEQQVLLQSGVGQGIFFAGPRHVAIEIIAFPTEHRIITTNPKDLLRMQEFAQEENEEKKEEKPTTVN